MKPKSTIPYITLLVIFLIFLTKISSISVNPTWIQNPHIELSTITFWSDDKSIFYEKH